MRIRRLRGTAALLAGVLALGAAALTTSTASAAPAAPGCDFADSGTGTYADTLCWLDLSSLDGAVAGTPAGQPLSLGLPGGYRLQATVTVSGGAVAAAGLPTYVGSWLGNSGHYTGIDPTVRPALYQQGTGTTSTATLSDVRVTDASGAPVTGWSLVGADAEETAGGESLTWTADSPFTSLTARPGAADELGNACTRGYTGIGTTTVTCTGGPIGAGGMTGTAIVAAREPSTFSQTMTSRNGREAVAFGVLVSRVSITKQVVGGFGGDAFRVGVTDAVGRTVASADTTGSASATTGDTTILVAADGNPLTFAETPLGTTDPARYAAPSWSCTRNGVAASDLPQGDAVGTSRAIPVGVGDAVACTITNSALSSGLALAKDATVTDGNADRLVDAGDRVTWTFTATNTGAVPLTGLAVADPTAGPVVCDATDLAAGASTTCRTTAPTVLTSADEDAGSVTNTATASATVAGTTSTVQSASASAEVRTERPDVAVTVVPIETTPTTLETTVEVENTGTVPLTNVAVEVPGAEPVTVLDVAPGDREQVSVSIPLDREPTTATVTATATPSGSLGDADPVTATTEVALPAATTPLTPTPTGTATPTPAAVPVGQAGQPGPTSAGALAFTGPAAGLGAASIAALGALLLGVFLLRRRRHTR
ncbi:DUF11 domain-containing protein [Curtobacterium flaccumfaciens pv. beticola]|uniref:DUF7507 domain-containing protein n=1 Tax=Curtobacterium flaccumfaciens TaxID=2035 RepID=UPI00349F2802|nr:DUF11 domain-containing protein [Curtobacterium flaccumfaciens pv. basellae]